MSESSKRLNPLHVQAYKELFGLNGQQLAYFNEMDTIEFTMGHLFVNVMRSALLTYSAPKTDVITSALRLRIGDTEIIYGYVHSFGETPTPQFYCISGHFLSQDGEYRKDLIPITQYAATMEMFEKPVTMIMDHIRSLIDDASIVVTMEHFPTHIELGMLPIFILAIAWFHDAYMISHEIIDKCLFGDRIKLITQFPGGEKLLSRVLNISGFNALPFFGVAKYPNSKPTDLNCGQKLIPMPMRAMAEPHDIRHTTWRELYVNELVSHLIMNNVCTGFAFTPGWFYIPSSTARLYDGVAAHRKYENSEVAHQIAQELSETGEKALRSPDEYPVDDPRHDIQTPINDRFAELRRRIINDIGYVDDHLLLSDYSLCMMSVHTNVTLSNIGLLANVYTNKPIMKLDIFRRIVFDYMYDLYCLHTRTNVIHGDLHVSNATIERLNVFEGVKYGNTAYAIGDDFYTFRYDGFVGCIIDFSRAIIGDMAAIAQRHSPQYADLLQTSQVSEIVDLVRRYFPAVHRKYEFKFRLLAEDHYDAFFKVCTILDVYSLMTGCKTMLEVTYKDVDTDVREFVEDIVAAAEQIFAQDMDHLMQTQEPPVKAPTLRVIEKIFSEQKIRWPPPEGLVTHVVNSNNPLRWGIDDPATWNPLVDPTKDIEIFESVGIPRPDLSYDNRKFVAAHLAAEEETLGEIAKKYTKITTRGGAASLAPGDDDPSALINLL